MYKTNVCFSSIDDVKAFINSANKFDFNINLIWGKILVNGKSLIGIFSLPLKKPICLKAECDKDNPFVNEIIPFTV